MRYAQIIGLTTIATLLLAVAALVVSLVTSNPLAETAQWGPALVTVVLVAVALGAVFYTALRRARTSTPYW